MPASLFLVAASGLALLALRETAAMGLPPMLHLGAVLGLLASMPYGKFMHGPFRAAALLRAVNGTTNAGWRRRSDRRSDLDFHRHSLKCAAHAEKSAGATGKAVERHRHEFGSQRRITSLVPIEDEIADASLRVPLTRRKNVLICGLRLALSVCEC